jgi:hypothetical protein
LIDLLHVLEGRNEGPNVLEGCASHYF